MAINEQFQPHHFNISRFSFSISPHITPTFGMEIIRNAAAHVGSLIPTSFMDWPKVETPSPQKHFPKFSQFPLELRIKIWKLALTPRVIHLHHRVFSPAYNEEIQAWNGYAPAAAHASSLTLEEISRLPIYRPLTEEEGGEMRNSGIPTHVALTPCSGTHPCGCKRFPPHSRFAPPLPGVLLACHESRNNTIAAYKRVLEGEYDNRGFPIVPPTVAVIKSSISEPPVTGAILNPAIDIIALTVNVASRFSVLELKHLTGMVARQIPDITKVVLRGSIAMPPYKFWSSARFRYWESWGQDSWWVPAAHLIKFQRLKEVIFFYHKEKKRQQLLPDEWKARTQAQWESELLKVESMWPDSWKGMPPTLTFVTDLESI
jgi:hypothetical protein